MIIIGSPEAIVQRYDDHITLLSDPTNPDTQLTSEQAAKLLGVSLRQFYYLRKDNVRPLPYTRSGSRVWFSRKALLKFKYAAHPAFPRT